MADDDTRNEEETGTPRGWSPHPHERMLITPLVAGLGGTARLLHGRLYRRLAADPHLRSSGVVRLDAALRQRGQGSQPLRRERLLRLPFRVLPSAGRSRSPVLPLSQGFAARRLLRERPVARPARNRTHGPGSLAGVGLASGRTGSERTSTTRALSTRFADACDEVALLRPAGREPDHVRRDAKRQVGALRYARQLYSKHVVRRIRGSSRRRRAIRVRTREQSGGYADSGPPKGQLEEAPNSAQIDRGYWLSGDPCR